METVLSRAQMVPSGGLLRAKMAPAGTQMGSGNLINAGIVSTQWTEKRKKGKIHIRSEPRVCVCAHARIGGHSQVQRTRPFGTTEVKPGPRACFKTAADLIHLAVLKVNKKKNKMIKKKKKKKGLR